MTNSRVFCVLDVSSHGLDRCFHLLRLRGWHYRVRSAVEYPDGHRPDLTGGSEIRISRSIDRGRWEQASDRQRRNYATANDSQSSEFTRMLLRNVPAPIATHGYTGQVCSIGVALEFP